MMANDSMRAIGRETAAGSSMTIVGTMTEAETGTVTEIGTANEIMMIATETTTANYAD
jgi:hypothetical protein